MMVPLPNFYHFYNSPDFIQEYARECAAIVDRYTCYHTKLETRYQWRGQNKYFARQCTDCGARIDHVKKDNILAPNSIPAWDYYLPKHYIVAKDQALIRLYAEFRKKAKDLDVQFEIDQRADYEKYINSPEWKRRRRKVLERDNHTCQACLDRSAEHVHHLTYEHLGDELLFELVSVCRFCHAKIHAKRNYDEVTTTEDEEHEALF